MCAAWGDYGYIAAAGQLWAWFCTTNALARSLGLMPFKDVFRADGLLIKPDVAIAAVDASMLGAPAFAPELLVAECYSDHRAGRWSYALGMHANPGADEVIGEIVLAELGDSAPTGDVAIWDWRSATVTVAGPEARLPLTLAKEDWAYFVIAPTLADGRLAVIGDVSKFVTAGDARIEVDPIDVPAHDDRSGSVRITVKGTDETVTITGWSTAPATVTPDRPDVGDGDGQITPIIRPTTWDETTGVWTVSVRIGSRGWETVQVSV